MKTTTIILSLLGAASTALAHGVVTEMVIDGQTYAASNPYQNPAPDCVMQAFPTAGNGFVDDVTSTDITCNKGATAAKLIAPAQAGSSVNFKWTVWPDSHKGPVMTYMANCGGSCTTVTASKLKWFKIDHSGYDASSSIWGSDKLIALGNQWNVNIPKDIANGEYLIRHEILALHSAYNSSGAQFYPSCTNLKITGGGNVNPGRLSFPGAYKAADPGILINIYQRIAGYVIPGGDVYTAGGAIPDGLSTGAASEVGSPGSGSGSSLAPVPSGGAYSTSSTTSQEFSTLKPTGTAGMNYGLFPGTGGIASPTFVATIGNAYGGSDDEPTSTTTSTSTMQMTIVVTQHISNPTGPAPAGYVVNNAAVDANSGLGSDCQAQIQYVTVAAPALTVIQTQTVTISIKVPTTIINTVTNTVTSTAPCTAVTTPGAYADSTLDAAAVTNTYSTTTASADTVATSASTTCTSPDATSTINGAYLAEASTGSVPLIKRTQDCAACLKTFAECAKGAGSNLRRLASCNQYKNKECRTAYGYC